MPARGIIGRKPSIGTSSAYSDVFSPGYQYDVSSTSTWPSSSGGTGEFIIINNDYGNATTLFVKYKKFSDGKYYPYNTTINKLNRIASESIVSGSATPGARYVAVATQRYIDIYKLNTADPRVSDYTWLVGFTVTSSTSSPIYDIEFDPSGTYLAVGSGESNYFRVWKRSGDSFNEITPITQPGAAGVRSISWNHDGSSIAVGFGTSPYLAIYNRSGDTFTKLATPASIPTTVPSSLAWNHDGSSLATKFANFTVQVYNRSADTFSSAASITLPGSSSIAAYQMTWNYNGTLLAIGTNNLNNFPTTRVGIVSVYSRSGNTFTALSVPSTWGPDYLDGCIFTADGKELIIATGARGEIWDVSGTTISRPYTYKYGFFHSTAPAVTGSLPYLGNAYDSNSYDDLSANLESVKVLIIKGL